MSFVVRGVVEKGLPRSLIAVALAALVEGVWDSVWGSVWVWDCDVGGCGELLGLSGLLAGVGDVVWRRVRMEVRAERISRDEGETSIGGGEFVVLMEAWMVVNEAGGV
jgi:hypothetical protein